MPKQKSYRKPEDLWKAFENYREQVKNNPRTRQVFGGKDFNVKTEQLERPLTLEGFYCYCLDNHTDAHHYFENTEGRYDKYGGICSRIRNEIRRDQIEGGMVGQYNPSITQRLNGLKEQQDINHGGNVQVLNIDPLDGDSK